MSDVKKDKNDRPIDTEMATAEFDRFCEAWELDNDESTLDNESKIDFTRLKKQFITAVERGRLSFNDDETLSYTFSDKSASKAGQVLKMGRPKGAAYMEMDKYKEQQGIHKFYSVMAAMSGHDPKYFSDIDGIDLKPLQAIVSLFLAG